MIELYLCNLSIERDTLKFLFFRKSFLVIWVIGLVVAFFSFRTVEFYESRKLHDQLEIQFHGKVKLLEQSIRSLSELIYATQKFMQNGNSPSQSQFQRFLDTRTGIGSGIHSVLWVPLVASDDVMEFEQQAKKEGLLGFRLLPSMDQTSSCAFGLGSATLPVYYVSPQFEASDFLGQRLDTHCDYSTAMKSSLLDQGIATSVFEDENNPGVKLFLPVLGSENELQGFVVASVLFHEFLGVTWKSEINSNKLNISVANTSTQNDSVIFQSHVNLALEKASYYDQVLVYTQVVELPLIGQNWTISISMIDDKTRLLIYGSTAVILILLLTVSVSIGVSFYAHRLQISDRIVKEKTESLEIQATRDELTGLFNRQSLSEKIEHQLELIGQEKTRGFSILFVDLDRFKVINDSMGHIVGDHVLQQVAFRLKNNARKGDISFRFGGDEFVICLPNQVDEKIVGDLCQRFSDLLSKPYSIKGQTCHLGASIGVSIVTSPSESLASILREADTAMYKAKQSGTEKVVFFNDSMFIQAKQRFVLEQELAIAIESNQLSLVYQPIFCQKTERVSGFEALLRWNHPEKGLISPAEFIPVAEEAGLIIKMGDWVVRQVCEILELLWHDSSLSYIPRININVSAKQFESNHIIHTLQCALSKAQFPANLLGIEITESLLLSDSSCTVNALKEIKDLGVKIYLDDFGTGYSSLSVLSEYPVDTVKIDQSFVRQIDNVGHKSSRLCKGIISMAHSISLEVVAEGVETDMQLATLRGCGCNYVQGFLKAKPVSSDVMGEYLTYKPSYALQAS
ncbi:diguanylate cyclase [Vibrio genomosp. F10 str. ZF-129]|uniref:Diguanylate cyclase n=1 Tax=Vibrio genomosp. F10 str. ZF-129 TaxID=1187848 RepID=A0A1E5BGV7_9VIBR|nr:EAL domain-containing protein [Vibrio genomosp. F10]OEE35845.1 diguanylate cyclase [Vibrio genomosp. F10 str. ZF-129]